MLLERPLSLQLIFHYYNQFKSFFLTQPKLKDREREIEVNMNECNLLTIFFFSFSLFFLSSSTLHCFLVLLRFFLFLSRFRSVPLASLFLFVLVVFFLLLSIPAFFFVPFVDVVLWCLKTVVYSNQVRFESLKTLLAQAPNRRMLYSHLQRHNDKDAARKTHDKDAGRLL